MTDKIITSSYSVCCNTLRSRLAEDKPGYVQILTGPRQVGKTTMLHEIERTPGWEAIYASVEAVEAALPQWWENLIDRARRTAARGKVVLLLDEVQYLPDWGRRVKAAYDSFKRFNLPIRIVLSGSSSLKLGKGARETMAGRFERLFLSHWPPRELARVFGLSPQQAVWHYVTKGGYPGALVFQHDEERWRDYVWNSIIEPAIGRDLLALEVVRRPALLRQIFAVAVGHPSEVVSLQKLRGELADAGALETVSHYLHLLEEAYLVAALPKFSKRAVRRRAAPPKLIVLNQAIIRAARPKGLPDVGPENPHWGRLVENACAAFAWNAGQEVYYWREEPWEVDFVTTGSWGAWAVELKTGSFNTYDLRALLEFCSRYREFRPLLLCDREVIDRVRDLPVTVMPWDEYLWVGPPS